MNEESEISTKKSNRVCPTQLECCSCEDLKDLATTVGVHGMFFSIVALGPSNPGPQLSLPMNGNTLYLNVKSLPNGSTVLPSSQ